MSNCTLDLKTSRLKVLMLTFKFGSCYISYSPAIPKSDPLQPIFNPSEGLFVVRCIDQAKVRERKEERERTRRRRRWEKQQMMMLFSKNFLLKLVKLKEIMKLLGTFFIIIINNYNITPFLFLFFFC